MQGEIGGDLGFHPSLKFKIFVVIHFFFEVENTSKDHSVYAIVTFQENESPRPSGIIKDKNCSGEPRSINIAFDLKRQRHFRSNTPANIFLHNQK